MTLLQIFFASERVLKIGQYVAKYGQEYGSLVLTDDAYIMPL